MAEVKKPKGMRKDEWRRRNGEVFPVRPTKLHDPDTIAVHEAGHAVMDVLLG